MEGYLPYFAGNFKKMLHCEKMWVSITKFFTSSRPFSINIWEIIAVMNAVLIKKYSNRRLYDTDKSEYITVSQVAEMIRSSKVIKVIDAGTEEDVTSYILTQILLEESRKKNILLPASLLHMVIRFGDNVLNDFFGRHLQYSMEKYIERRSLLDDQFRAIFQVSTEFSQVIRKTFGELYPFNPFANMFTSPSLNGTGKGEETETSCEKNP